MAEDSRWLRYLILAEGPFLYAAGKIAEIKPDFYMTRSHDLAGLDYAVSLAFPLVREALDGIKDQPTLLYKHLYRQVNNLMDRFALKLALTLQARGSRAIPIPASQLLDWQELRAHLSHRQAATHLGVGWYGRNNLLVTARHGAQVRLVTVLTDLPLSESNVPASELPGCGSCRACAKVCPVNAIHEGPADFDRPACFAKVKQFERIQGIGQQICGICIKACPGPQATSA
jgi:epoxyqueuosine reductase QueG